MNGNTPRPATPDELAAWERFKRYYESELTPAVKRANVTAEICYAGQVTIENAGAKGFVFDTDALNRNQSVLNRYNAIGRYIQGVESGRYFLRQSGGDLDILALESMPYEQYAPDIYANLGLGPIVYALAIGAVLALGVWGIVAALKTDAERQAEINEGRLIEADTEMMKQPEPIRAAWIDYRLKAQAQAQTVGALEKFFGSKTAGTIGTALAVGVLAIAAAFAFQKRE